MLKKTLSLIPMITVETNKNKREIILTVLLMLANNLPLNSTKLYAAPFISFSATTVSLP